MEEKPVVHGLLYSYVGRGCRCGDCTAAMRDYSARYRSSPEGRERTRRSSRRSNFLRQKAVNWVKKNEPELYLSFEQEWADRADN